VAKSSNGGVPGSWRVASNGLPDVPVERLHADYRDPSGQSLFAATALGVYFTSDGGTNWTLFGAGLPQVVVTDLYMPLTEAFCASRRTGVGSGNST